MFLAGTYRGVSRKGLALRTLDMLFGKMPFPLSIAGEIDIPENSATTIEEIERYLRFLDTRVEQIDSGMLEFKVPWARNGSNWDAIAVFDRGSLRIVHRAGQRVLVYRARTWRLATLSGLFAAAFGALAMSQGADGLQTGLSIWLLFCGVNYIIGWFRFRAVFRRVVTGEWEL